MGTTRWFAAIGVGIVMALSAAGCGDDDGGEVRTLDDGAGDSSSGSASAVAGECGAAGGVSTSGEADSEVEVTLGEWIVTLEPTSTTAGVVEFVATNGGSLDHELVIVAAESPDELTVVEGKVDEDALPEGAFIGEIEAFEAGLTCDGYVDLAPGDYVLFCNLVEGDGTSHFESGMVTTFNVS
ncbi:MAG: hypothetical protein KDB21_15050 [Acidimicrobiales bacterium]|nr:hypothetical protein [Acidimicrobiales bacterium]